MIDQAINEVFQRDKKVFIPDFGAIIYSEISDSINFNDLLNFDDGKIIEEIQKQQNIPEDEAQEALSEYVENAKKSINQGQLHFFGGIGYLSKDTNGTYSIEKAGPSPKAEEKAKSLPTKSSKAKTPTKKKATSAKTKTVKKPKESKEKKKPEIAAFPEKSEKEISDDQPEGILTDDSVEIDLHIDEVSNENVETVNIEEDSETNSENAYTYYPVLSEEDENVQDYYKRKEKFYHEDKRRHPIVIAALIILPVIIAIAAYFYLHKEKSSDTTSIEEPQNSALVQTVTDDNITGKDAQESTGPEKIENEKDSRQSTSENIKSEEKPVTTKTTTNRNTAQTRSFASEQERIYSLILGSFKLENNADRFQQRLQQQGMEVSKFRRSSAFYFVGFEHIEGKSNAVELLTKFREEEPTAWIIRKQ